MTVEQAVELAGTLRRLAFGYSRHRRILPRFTFFNLVLACAWLATKPCLHNREYRLGVTTSGLTRAAAVAAIAAGTIFIGVQVGHPQLTPASITSTNVSIREYLKVVFAALAVAGITGMYLNQVRRNGLLGLIGYLLLAVGYLSIMCTTFIGAFVAPTIADTNPGYVSDVIALATSRGSVTGDLGSLDPFWKFQGVCYLAGGLIFGIALFRAHVLARWACVLLAAVGPSAPSSCRCPTPSTACSPFRTASP